MAASVGGFLGGFNPVIQKKLQEAHDREQKDKQSQIDMYSKIYADPVNYNDSQRAAAKASLDKLYGPQTKKGLAALDPLLKAIHLAHGQAAQQPPQGQQPHGGQPAQPPQQSISSHIAMNRSSLSDRAFAINACSE